MHVGPGPVLCCVLALSTLHGAAGQSTRQAADCALYDDSAGYAVVSDGGACGTTATLKQQLKEAEARNLELTEEMVNLHASVMRLLESEQLLTSRTQQLTSELDTVKRVLERQDQGGTDCPHGYTLRSDEYGSCYMFVGRDLSWFDAETFCQSAGGHLLAIETAEEQSFVATQIRSNRVLPGNHFWVGGNDIALENDWVWAGLNAPFNFTKWLLYPGNTGPVQQPDNHQGEEHCVQLFHLHGYDWNDIYCGNKYFFICEYKLL